MNAWNNFNGGNWENEINVRDFIQKNYTRMMVTALFWLRLPHATALREKFDALLAEEREKGGVRNIDTETVITITAFGPGYLDKDNEVIVGLQTDEPLKRACNPFGGMRMVRDACKQYGYEVSPKIEEEFKYHKTHNDGVFSAYTKDVREARHVGLLTGLPDAYGRGRIIGDYRRVALYGVNRLIEEKQKDKDALGSVPTTEKEIRCAEELSDQIKALKDMIAMAASYGFDITRPAENAKEAVQWLYFGYLAGIKEQNGAAMSLGRTSTFLDIYFERDIAAGLMTESEAQGDHGRFRAAPAYGAPPAYAGVQRAVRRRPDVDHRGSRRHRRGRPSHGYEEQLPHAQHPVQPERCRRAESDRSVGENLPENWKKFIAKVSIDTDALQYENDDVMRPYYGDDYAIACCVSAMRVGKDMQFFGARANIAKLMMMAINGGRDENKFEQVGPEMPVMDGDVLDYEEVLRRMDFYRPWLAKTYVSAMNTIHYMHDKYAYEKSQMALHDTEVRRLMAFGIAGMSCMADSLSAIKYAKVKPIRNPENGIIVDFEIEGDFPKFGNDDDRVDRIACEQVEKFYQALTQFPLYRGAIHTMSILTITSNVMYGKKTGNTPDGRRHGEPLAPGANPMSGRDVSGALASLNSVAKLSYTYCRDGISNTFSITPGALGKTDEEQVNNLVAIMGGYFAQNAHHLNVNVLNRETLMAAYEHPEQYPNLTIRVSGYAVNFYKLSREQQREVISRTFHEAI